MNDQGVKAKLEVYIEPSDNEKKYRVRIIGLDGGETTLPQEYDSVSDAQKTVRSIFGERYFAWTPIEPQKEDVEPIKLSYLYNENAPTCTNCGAVMVRNGACYKCLNCGETDGCS